MKVVHPWTTGEIKRALKWRGEGLRYKDIAVLLGRGVGSVSTMFRDQRRRDSRVSRIIANMEAAEQDRDIIPADEAESSELLRTAMLKSMLRWADCNGTTIDQAARFLLSGDRSPIYPQPDAICGKNRSFVSESTGA